MAATSSDLTSAPPTSPAPTSPPPGPAPGTPATGGSKSKRTVAIAVVAIVIVVLLVVSLALAGVLHLGGGGSSGSTANTSTEESAAATSGNLASGISGGPWSLVDAFGSDSTTTVTHNASSAFPGNATCYLQNGTISSVTVPAYSGNYSNGMAQLWLFEYYHADHALLIVVQNGAAHEVGEVGGPGCYFTGAPTLLPSGLVDSSAAAQAAVRTSAGASFARTYASANATYSLLNQGIYVRGTLTNLSVWDIDFQACSANTTQSFSSVVYATNATVLMADSSTGGSCGGSPHSIPIGTAFAAGNPISSVCATGDTYAANGCLAGDYTYTLTIETATASFASVLFEVRTPTGAIVNAPSVGGFTVVNIMGQIAAQMTTPTTALVMNTTFGTYGASPVCNGEACGPSTVFTSIYSIVIDMGTGNPTGQGYSFVVVGTGAYSGTTAPLSLP